MDSIRTLVAAPDRPAADRPVADSTRAADSRPAADSRGAPPLHTRTTAARRAVRRPTPATDSGVNRRPMISMNTEAAPSAPARSPSKTCTSKVSRSPSTSGFFNTTTASRIADPSLLKAETRHSAAAPSPDADQQMPTSANPRRRGGGEDDEVIREAAQISLTTVKLASSASCDP